MVWEYLQQFWQSIVEVANYPVEFFQNIGNAVAGAIGGLFESFFHFFNDLGLIFYWLAEQLKFIFLGLLSPVSYVFNTIKFFWVSAFQTPETPELSYTFSENILAVFNSIPHWDIVSSILASIVILVMGLAIIRLFLRS